MVVRFHNAILAIIGKPNPACIFDSIPEKGSGFQQHPTSFCPCQYATGIWNGQFSQRNRSRRIRRTEVRPIRNRRAISDFAEATAQVPSFLSVRGRSCRTARRLQLLTDTKRRAHLRIVLLVLKPRKNEESQGEPWLREKDLKFRVALVRPWSGPPIPARPTASAAVPLMAERVHTEYGIFRDPAKERKVADYFRCQQEAVADDIILFCRTAKENWGRPLVTGVFYGYFFFLFGRQQTGGHLEIQRVLASPWVDYLSAPQTYAPAFRGMGGSGQSRGLVESFTMHGKLLLDEMDQVPALYGKTGAEAEKALPESVAILRRNVAESYTRGHGMWFYDFGPGLGRKGWWDNAVLMEEIARMRRVFGAYFERPHRPQADAV